MFEGTPARFNVSIVSSIVCAAVIDETDAMDFSVSYMTVVHAAKSCVRISRQEIVVYRHRIVAYGRHGSLAQSDATLSRLVTKNCKSRS
jgi:hypothetical protein